SVPSRSSRPNGAYDENPTVSSWARGAVTDPSTHSNATIGPRTSPPPGHAWTDGNRLTAFAWTRHAATVVQLRSATKRHLPTTRPTSAANNVRRTLRTTRNGASTHPA